jgi:penicillin-binding protein 1A
MLKKVKKVAKNYKKIKHRSFLSLFIYFTVSCFFLSAILLMLLIFYVSKDLPSTEAIKNYKSSFTTRVYSHDGVLINNYSTENRIFVPIDEIPDMLKNAFISAEDSNFYHHPGIDLLGIIKASYKNALFLATGKGQLVGASTITQQAVKNILLTNERTFSRKIKEILLSLEVSKVLSKNEVLEIYLNHIYLGSGAYGVYAASLEYFGKNLENLSLEEIALLAALPKAPSEINPRRRKERAKERRNWVLRQMLENKYISQKDFMLAKDRAVVTISQKPTNGELSGTNAFADHVKSQISSAYGSDTFFSKGLFVQTTMDYEIQKQFFKSFREGILEYDKKQGFRGIVENIRLSKNACNDLAKFLDRAEIRDLLLKYAVVLNVEKEGIRALNEDCGEIIIKTETMLWANMLPNNFKVGDIIIYENNLEPSLSQLPEANGGGLVMNAKTGAVLAMIGDFYDRPNAFNRAIFAKRQIGSAIKPFVYLVALENGFSPNSILVDENLKLSDEWQPRNASRDFLGSVTLRVALERSRNVPTVRIAEILGTSKIVKRLSEIGLNADVIQNDLTTALGSLSVTVEKVASSTSIFLNNGHKIEAEYIEKIQDNIGKTIFSKDGRCGESCFNPNILPKFAPQEGVLVADGDASFQILSILEGAVHRGTSGKLKSLSPIGIAGKTGTTSEYKDAWSLVLTNDLIIVVYVGNDKPKTLGEGQYGAVLAVPIVKKTLEKILVKYPPTPFSPPQSLQAIFIDYKTGNLPSGTGTQKILEYFKSADKKPKAVRGTEEYTGEEDDDILNGIY